MDKRPPQLARNKLALRMLRRCAEQGFSDKDIQIQLEQEFGHKWYIGTIRENRKKLGIIKDPIHETESEGFVINLPPPGLTDKEKAEWFKNQFCTSHLYGILQQQFDVEEVHIYLEEYGTLCCQFEDIVPSEHYQIDDFIKHRLLINRELKDIKKWIGISDLTQEEIDANSLSDDPSKEERQVHMERVRRLNTAMQNLERAKAAHKQLVADVDRKYKGLAATRRDRLDELRGGKETFFELISNLQRSKEERDRQGKYAELMKLAADDVDKEFRRPQDFPDGSRRPIIYDADTLDLEELDEA